MRQVLALSVVALLAPQVSSNPFCIKTQVAFVRGGADNLLSGDEQPLEHEDHDVEPVPMKAGDETEEGQKEMDKPEVEREADGGGDGNDDEGEFMDAVENDEDMPEAEIDCSNQEAETLDISDGEDVFVSGNMEIVPEEGVEVEVAAFDVSEVAQQNTDDDSSGFVDRDELADAYDDDAAVSEATSFRAGHAEEDDRASIDDIPGAGDTTTERQDNEEETQASFEPAGAVQEENGLGIEEFEIDSSSVTKDVETILVKQCGFRKSEVKGLKPEIANVMAQKRLKRPLEGIPPSWYGSPRSRSAVLVATLRRVVSLAVPVALAALAISGGLDVGNILSKLIKKEELLIGDDLREPEEAATAADEMEDPFGEAEDDDASDEYAPPEPATKRRHSRGRFGRAASLENRQSPSDESWLDRGITSLEIQLKSAISSTTDRVRTFSGKVLRK
jgi:hypothetical protein